MKLIKAEASRLKINTSKIQAGAMDQNLLSSLTADSVRAALTPCNGIPLSTKEMCSRGEPQTERDSKEACKGETPLPPREGLQHSEGESHQSQSWQGAPPTSCRAGNGIKEEWGKEAREPLCSICVKAD